MLRLVQLSDQRDLISWRFTLNAEYSAKSAYLIQFTGSFSDYDWSRWWQTDAEAKCMFFCWLILQNKVWIADKIIKHGGSANPTCNLCFSHPETTLHMLAQCPFSKPYGQDLLLASISMFSNPLQAATAGSSLDDDKCFRQETKATSIAANVLKNWYTQLGISGRRDSAGSMITRRSRRKWFRPVSS
jgi:hypothetical protein